MEPEETRAPRRGVTPIDWTSERKEAFFDHLAIAASVTKSAAAIGVTPGAVHQLRHRDPAFAAAWEDAVEAGYASIEMRLIGHVLGGLSRGDAIEPVGHGAEAIDVELALRMLKERESRRSGTKDRGGRRLQRATAAETDATILAKLAVIAARKKGA